MNFIIIFLYTISALILCSCATETPKTTFDLTPYNFANSMHKYHRKPIQILITQPNSTKYYDSENIIVKDQFNSIKYLGNSQWADSLPNLIQNRLIEAFENSKFFRAVERPGQRMDFNYELITNIRNFNIFVVDKNTTKTKITIGAKILNERTGKVRATHIFNAEEEWQTPYYDAKKISSYNYAMRLNNSFKEITKEIILWVQKYS